MCKDGADWLPSAAMKIGLVGLAGSGKTTVFNSVTGLDAPVGGLGGDRTKPNLGVTKVPDVRVDKLTAMYNPKKTIPAEVTFVDLPGRMPNAGKGGLAPEAVAHIRDMDAMALVVRGFENPMLSDAADPVRDLGGLDDELLLTDLVVCEKRIDRLIREQKKTPELALLQRCLETMEAGRPLRLETFTTEEERTLSGYRFLTQKPALALLNAAEDDAASGAPAAFAALAADHGAPVLVMSGQVEMEIAGLEDPGDQAAFLEDLGLEGGAKDRFIQAAWGLLDTICFLTVGEDEVRAWEIQRGTPAVKAAGKIHSDIERGFIRAEVTPYADLIELGSEQACKEAGKLRLEGKEYVVGDGDIVHYRFNV